MTTHDPRHRGSRQPDQERSPRRVVVGEPVREADEREDHDQDRRHRHDALVVRRRHGEASRRHREMEMAALPTLEHEDHQVQERERGRHSDEEVGERPHAVETAGEAGCDCAARTGASSAPADPTPTSSNASRARWPPVIPTGSRPWSEPSAAFFRGWRRTLAGRGRDVGGRVALLHGLRRDRQRALLEMVLEVDALDAVGEPWRRGLALEVVVEELAHAHRVVALVLRLRQTVVLTLVLQHHHRLAEPAQGVEVLDALIEVDRAVLVVVQDHERRRDLARLEDRRVAQIGVGLVEEVAGEAALAALEDRLVGRARVPVDRAVHADQIGERRAGDGGAELVGLGDQERGLVAAPRVTVQADARRDRRRPWRPPPRAPAARTTPPTCPDR